MNTHRHDYENQDGKMVTSMKDLKRASRDGKKAISAMIRENIPALARMGYRKPKLQNK